MANGAKVFREQVLEHYRVRGYKLHERVKVRGRSGTVHACDLVAQGPLGNLIVSFGDAAGIEGPELAAIRRAARDIGAAAVVAVEEPSAEVRDSARRLGIKVLDLDAVEHSEPVVAEAPPREVEDHPWPEQESRMRRAQRQRDGAATVDLWKHPREEAKPKRSGDSFAWLEPGREASRSDSPRREREPSTSPTPAGRSSTRSPAVRLDADPAPRRESVVPAPTSRVEPGGRETVARLRPREEEPGREGRVQAAKPFPWQWVWGPAVYGAVTAALIWFAWFLFVKNG